MNDIAWAALIFTLALATLGAAIGILMLEILAAAVNAALDE